jgi:hypothetical protein
VFPAADFAALGNKPHWLVDWSIRPDHLTSPRTVHFPDNEVRLSTTGRGPENLSLNFDDNLGSDVMQFYRGPLVADIDDTSPGPREFYDVDHPAGVTPYLFDPSQGNLLLDWIGWLGASPSPRGDLVPGNIQTELAGSPFATQGVLIPALVYQFTFIPVTPGDYNHNGTLDAADIDDLTIQTARGTHPASYDLNADALVDAGDIKIWVGDLFHSWIGDANLDGQFNSTDLVSVLAAGTYEVDVDSVWSTGDFNGDGRTNSSDLVAALADGGYEMGPRPAVAAVPEPATPTLLVMAIVVYCARRRSSLS